MAPNQIRTESLFQEEHTKVETPVKEILYDGYFYDVTNFISRHPGGTVIEYYTEKGEDATVAVLQFHNRSKKKVDMIMNTLKKRKAKNDEIGLSLEKLKRHREMTKDFVELYHEAQKEGLFEPVYFRNALVILETILYLCLGGYILNYFNSWFMKNIGCIIFALGMGRMGLLQHEAGHLSVSGKPKLDKFLQNIFYGLFMGMSSRWWVRKHNRHHAMPQRVAHDFDMETLPLTALHKDFLNDPTSQHQNNWFTRNQGYTLPLNTIMYIFTFSFYYFPHYIIKRRLWDEILAISIHYAIAFSTIGVWPYLISKTYMSMQLIANFSINHTHLEITYEPTHWLEYATIHTANVVHNRFNDWWLILLNYQIEHHLFPTMPQYNLRFVVDRVKALTKKYKLPYETYTLWEGYCVLWSNVFTVQEHANKLHAELKSGKSS